MRNKRLFIVMLMILCMGLMGLPHQTYAHNHQHESPIPTKKPISNKGEKSTLQKLIDATEPGGTLLLEGRVYRGSMSITKPITIKGTEGTEIKSLATAFTISDTENVVLQDLVLQSDDVAIVASNIKSLSLTNIQIKESMAGIQITKSAEIKFQNVDVMGNEGHFSTKGHAIAIYESNNIVASESDIDSVMDGYYLEKVDDITLTNNRIENSRYAIHMMYSNKVELSQNELSNNMTGFMIMIAKDVTIKHNIVVKNNTLNSLGVYTYDVEDVQFTQNELRENTIAMDIQNTRNMLVEENVFSTNGTVLQAKRSGSLFVQSNEFYGNILTVRTDKEAINLQRNFYDDYVGKDYNGDGIGDTEYIATNSFGQWMVRKPVYQYFIESPSVVTLNMMDTEVTGNNALVIVDQQPVIMKKPFNFNLDINILQLLGSSIVLIGLFEVRRRLK